MSDEMPTSGNENKSDIVLESSTTSNLSQSLPGQIYEEKDATTMEWLTVVMQSGTLDFWNSPEEDGYTEADGEDI